MVSEMLVSSRRPFSERMPESLTDNSFPPSFFEKIAAILEALINLHPFVDGNKRTGLAVVAILLVLNGDRLTTSQEEAEEFVVRIATEHLSIAEIAFWLADHTERHTG